MGYVCIDFDEFNYYYHHHVASSLKALLEASQTKEPSCYLLLLVVRTVDYMLDEQSTAAAADWCGLEGGNSDHTTWGMKHTAVHMQDEEDDTLDCMQDEGDDTLDCMQDEEDDTLDCMRDEDDKPDCT